MSVTVSDMRVTSRDFQRDFARMKAKAKSGEAIYVTSGAEEFVFRERRSGSGSRRERKRPWQRPAIQGLKRKADGSSENTNLVSLFFSVGDGRTSTMLKK